MTKTNRQTERPNIVSVDDVLGGEFSMDLVSNGDMTTATWATINALSPTLEGADVATARLALQVAARIDADGSECSVILFNRLHSLLLDLHHIDRTPATCPLAQAPAAATE